MQTRKNFYEWFKMFIEYDNISDDAFKSAFTQRAELLEPAYGVATEHYFGDYAPFIAKALAYNNKQFYVYRAIDNPNKIAFLSRKQYYKMVNRMLSYTTSRKEWVKEYLRTYGKMSSPYKLFKKSFKENPRMKFLKDFFPIDDEGNCTNEDKLIKMCDLFMAKTLGLVMEEKSVQECYNLHLPGGYGGSGQRYATHSCMEGRAIGKFYNALPTHGMMIMRDGVGVGRFLLWDLPDGRQYVDRLYCLESEANACLELIDRTYPNALKYPLQNDQAELKFDIPFKDMEVFETDVLMPYVDTFYKMYSKGDKLCLSNNRQNHDGYTFQTDVHFASGGRGFKIRKCPHCGKIWFGYDCDLTEQERHHKYICTAYKPRGKQLQAYLKVYREMEEQLNGGNDNGTEGFVYEV